MWHRQTWSLHKSCALYRLDKIEIEAINQDPEPFYEKIIKSKLGGCVTPSMVQKKSEFYFSAIKYANDSKTMTNLFLFLLRVT